MKAKSIYKRYMKLKFVIHRYVQSKIFPIEKLKNFLTEIFY